MDQALVLENEYKKCNLWSKAKMEELARSLQLKVSQVYKWMWDRN